MGQTWIVLEILVVPACFVVAGAVGYRLGTPPRVAAGLLTVGAAHLLAFLGAHQALAAEGAAANWIHLASQVLFLAGFVALVWLAASYPDSAVSPKLLAFTIALGVASPLLASVSGPTPVVSDDSVSLGPIVHLLPAAFADASGVPLMLLPAVALVTYSVRYRRATMAARSIMRWPIAGFAAVAVLATLGTALGTRYEEVVTPLFLVGAPIVPLSIAFGPVARRLEDLGSQLADAQSASNRRASSANRLTMLSPREIQVLEAMAQGHANPVIARSMHLSLSSIEKHATSVFRKLQIADGPEVHRRVAAVVAYRDAIEAPEDPSPEQTA